MGKKKFEARVCTYITLQRRQSLERRAQSVGMSLSAFLRDFITNPKRTAEEILAREWVSVALQLRKLQSGDSDNTELQRDFGTVETTHSAHNVGAGYRSGNSMICASRLAHSFHAVARYLESPKSHREDRVRVAWIEGRNVISDENLQAAAREMNLIATADSRVKRPVLHMSISWAPEDDPSRNQMTEVSDRVLAKLNLQDHQAMLVAHGG